MNKDYEKKSRSAASKFLGGENIPADQEAPAAEKPKRTPATKKTAAPANKDKKPKGKGLTVWMDPEAINELTRYAGAIQKKKGEVISAALAEYMKKHPATAEQKKAYNDKQKDQMFNV